jgi:AraC-like DNA-binding protein
VASVTLLLRTRFLAIGEFRCPPGDEAWRRENVIGDRVHVVFPRIPVVIRQAGAQPVLATPNHTMLYNAGQLYERELRNERGDDCVFVELQNASLAGLMEGDRFQSTHVPADRRTYLLQHLLVRHLRSGAPDALSAEELAVRLLLVALSRSREPERTRRPGTDRAHRELAEAAKAELVAAPAARLTLDELARRLHASPFHLARVFSAETGFTLSRYRRALRLRAALERLPSSERDLSGLALELGFSSHSHFATSFRREFGVPPSALAGDRRIPELLELEA